MITAKELTEMTPEARAIQFQGMSPGELWDFAHSQEVITAPSHILVAILTHVTDRWYRPERWATGYTKNV